MAKAGRRKRPPTIDAAPRAQLQPHEHPSHAARGNARALDTSRILQQQIKGIRIPIRGIPGGGVRLPPLSVAQLGLVGLGAGLGGLAVYTALVTPPESSSKEQRPRKRWLPRVFGSGTVASDALSYGTPGNVHDLLLREAYVAAYDRARRHPAWTAEHLTAASLKRSSAPSDSASPPSPAQAALPPPSAASPSSSPPSASTSVSPTPIPGDIARPEAVLTPAGKIAAPVPGAADRLKSEFHEDHDVPEIFRAKLVDYVGSGYDRGHMVAAADAKRNQAAMNETFKLTNIAPQVGEGFNRHYWAWLESFCRNLTKSFEDVYVFTIPLYLPKLDPKSKKWRISYEVIGPPGLAPSISVPTHFAKVVLARRKEGEAGLAAFVLPNAKIADLTPLESFLVPVDSVERAAGLIFFSDEAKAQTRGLCEMTKCEVVRRFFDDSGNISVLEAPADKKRKSVAA